MRTARQRRLQPQQTRKVATTQPTVTAPAQKQKSTAKPQKTSHQALREKKQEVKKMEEEPEVEEDSYDSQEDFFEQDEESLESQREKLREKVAPETLDELRPNGELYVAIKDRYEELLKELFKSQGELDEFNFSEEEKKILNDRVKIWLEYFAITSAFRKKDVNLFEYIDTFTETQKFI